MALKKSQIYSSLWQSCDELRGGMDASQYKDYILTLLFIKYVSDKHAGDPDALNNNMPVVPWNQKQLAKTYRKSQKVDKTYRLVVVKNNRNSHTSRE